MSDEVGSRRSRGSPCARPTSCSSAARFRARSRAGPTRCTRKRRRSCWRTPRRRRARTRGTRWSRPATRSAAGRARPLTTAARSSTGSPRCWRAGPAQFAAEVAAAEGVRAAAAEAEVGCGHRPLGLVRGLDATRSPRSSAAPTRSPGLTSTSACPSRPAWSPSSRPRTSSLLGLVSVVAPVIATGNTAVVVASEDRPLPAITLAEVLATSDVPGGVVNVLTGRTGRARPGAGRPHGRQRHRPDRGAERRRAAELERRRRATSSGCSAATTSDWAATPGTAPAAGVPGDQDGLAPGRDLTGCRTRLPGLPLQATCGLGQGANQMRVPQLLRTSRGCGAAYSEAM